MVNFSVLKNISRAKKYPRGAVVSAAGNAAGMVVILKGEAGIYSLWQSPGEELVSTLGPGDAFGEASLFLGIDEPFTAVALTDVIAVPVARPAAASFVREEPDMACELMKELCAKLDALSSAYEKLSGRPWADPKTRQSEAPASNAAEAARVSLFPEGHGNYGLDLHIEDRNYLMERAYACPICKKEFVTLAVRTSKLVQEITDSDMRHRYKGIEPLYYDVVACPQCLYSALEEMFAKPDNPRADLHELQALKAGVPAISGTVPDAASVFAGYYLALLCAPKCFLPRRLAEGKLLLKLSRIYGDCGDAGMEERTARLALDAYMKFYLNEESDPSQDQQICIVLGELFLKVKDLKNAREYFFKAKTNRFGAPMLREQAENRLADIRALEGKG